MLRHTSTHTYVSLEISEAAYNEIKQKLIEADYRHAIHDTPDGGYIDMQGLAVTPISGPRSRPVTRLI